MLYAEGNVAITMKGGSSGNDTATANSLLLNTSTLEGVFDGGRIVQTQSDALSLARKLDPNLTRVKVGNELFTAAGPDLISRLHELRFEVFSLLHV